MKSVSAASSASCPHPMQTPLGLQWGGEDLLALFILWGALRRGWRCPEPGGYTGVCFAPRVTSGQGQRCCPHPCWIDSRQPLCKARSIFSHRHLQGKISWRGHLEAGGRGWRGGYSGWFLPLRGVLLGSLTPALWSALRGCIHPCTVFVGAALRGSHPPKTRGEKRKGMLGGGG